LLKRIKCNISQAEFTEDIEKVKKPNTKDSTKFSQYVVASKEWARSDTNMPRRSVQMDLVLTVGLVASPVDFNGEAVVVVRAEPEGSFLLVE